MVGTGSTTTGWKVEMRTVGQVEPKDRWRVAEEIQKDIVGTTSPRGLGAT